jgi:hypothetical protein
MGTQVAGENDRAAPRESALDCVSDGEGSGEHGGSQVSSTSAYSTLAHDGDGDSLRRVKVGVICISYG